MVVKGHGSGFKFNPSILGAFGVSLWMARMPLGSPQPGLPRLHPACALTTHSVLFPKQLLMSLVFSLCGRRPEVCLHSRNVFRVYSKAGRLPSPFDQTSSV